jgi:hypothetical protein
MPLVGPSPWSWPKAYPASLCRETKCPGRRVEVMAHLGGDADIASLAALLADQGRARILLALGDGRALAASRLVWPPPRPACTWPSSLTPTCYRSRPTAATATTGSPGHR